jgi:hypothetical protein
LGALFVVVCPVVCCISLLIGYVAVSTFWFVTFVVCLLFVDSVCVLFAFVLRCLPFCCCDLLLLRPFAAIVALFVVVPSIPLFC